MGFGVWGYVFGVWGLGLWVWGLGFKFESFGNEGLWLKIQSVEFKFQVLG